MPIETKAVTATGGSASVLISHNLSQMVRVVSQISVGSTPVRGGVTANIQYNGSQITSTAVGSGGDAASGPPSLTLYAGDLITVTWNGVLAGDTCTATSVYQETPIAQLPTSYGGQRENVVNPWQ